MPTIDKNMYARLKNWCDWDEGGRTESEHIIYVNRNDRELTDATIRKLIIDLNEEDEDGELYVALYSAENFYHCMRKYYSDIAELYFQKPSADDALVDIINSCPSTGGWLMLIVEDIEQLSGKEEMQIMMDTILAFSSRKARIILVGDGEYRQVFAGCELAVNEISDGFLTNDKDELVVIGCYEQTADVVGESVFYVGDDSQVKELNAYWELVYEQLETKYFDYVSYKWLYKETLEYIIPRVTPEQVYRKDICLVEYIGKMREIDNKNLEGCALWEFDAAQEFSKGLYRVITNGRQNILNAKKIEIGVMVKECEEDLGGIYISGIAYTSINVNADTASDQMDELSEVIRGCTYRGDGGHLWEYMRKNIADRNTRQV